MGLLSKFRKAPNGQDADSSLAPGTRFDESDEHDEEALERESRRRDLVARALRECMRRHAVPSDWIERRLVAVVTSKRKTGTHVQLVVKQGHTSLVGYVPAFQSSFMAELEKGDVRVWDWLLSISWEFAGVTASTGGQMPAASAWKAPAPAAPAPAKDSGLRAEPSAQSLQARDDDEVAQDLNALFAIRDAVFDASDRDGHGGSDFEDTQPATFVPSGAHPPR